MSKNKRLQGEIIKARNGYMQYEIKQAKFSFLPLFLEILSKEFAASSPENEEIWVSSISGDIELRGVKCRYGCNYESGVYISSWCDLGDKLIKVLAPEINTRLKKVNLSEHICI